MWFFSLYSVADALFRIGSKLCSFFFFWGGACTTGQHPFLARIPRCSSRQLLIREAKVPAAALPDDVPWLLGILSVHNTSHPAGRASRTPSRFSTITGYCCHQHILSRVKSTSADYLGRDSNPGPRISSQTRCSLDHGDVIYWIPLNEPSGLISIVTENNFQDPGTASLTKGKHPIVTSPAGVWSIENTAGYVWLIHLFNTMIFLINFLSALLIVCYLSTVLWSIKYLFTPLFYLSLCIYISLTSHLCMHR